MKKLKYLLLILLMPVIASAYTGSYGMSGSECVAFADYFKTLSGSYEYKYCYRAGCSTNGTWNIANMSASSGYRCSNGNAEPYAKWSSDGCSKFSGSCTINQGVYCTRVKTVDCNKKSDGSPYNSPTQKTSSVAQPSKTVTAKTTKSTTKTRATGGGGNKTTKPVTTTSTSEVTRPAVETEPVKSNNLNIAYITVEGKDLHYVNGYDNLTIRVAHGTNDLNITVSTEDPKTRVEIEGANNMPDEDCVIKIKVIAEDGSEKEIKINVERFTGESDKCLLANIAISDYELKDFDKNKYVYNLKVDRKTKSLYMDIIPVDPLHSTVEVLGNNNLANNSVVTINVKAENGKLCTYNITIKKSSGLWIPVVIIVIITGILLAAGYFVYRYIKRSKDMYQYE